MTITYKQGCHDEDNQNYQFEHCCHTGQCLRNHIILVKAFQQYLNFNLDKILGRNSQLQQQLHECPPYASRGALTKTTKIINLSIAATLVNAWEIV